MPIVLMPYDERSSLIAKEVQRAASRQKIFLTNGMDNIKVTLSQMQDFDYDFGIGIRTNIDNSPNNKFKIICSGKDIVPQVAVDIEKNLTNIIKSNVVFQYYENMLGRKYKNKAIDHIDSFVNSWFSEIRDGERKKKPVIVIELGSENNDILTSTFVNAILRAVGETIEPAPKIIASTPSVANAQKEVKPVVNVVKQQPFNTQTIVENAPKPEEKTPEPIIKKDAVFELSLEPKKEEIKNDDSLQK